MLSGSNRSPSPSAAGAGGSPGGPFGGRVSGNAITSWQRNGRATPRKGGADGPSWHGSLCPILRNRGPISHPRSCEERLRNSYYFIDLRHEARIIPDGL